MFTHALVGVDGTATGRDAVALARQLVDPDGTLTLAHVRRHEADAEDEDSLALLERERREAAVDANLVGVVSASPGRGLHEQAERERADLLVVGSSRRGALGRAVLGDDTCAALNGARCAVAIAPSGYGAYPRTLAKVAVGFDGSPESLAALAMARKLAATTTATIHALDVVSLPTIAYGGYLGPSFEQAIQAPLQQARQRLSELPDVTAHAVPGLAGEELAAFGDDVDILVVGSRGYGPVQRLVLGSTSNYLARHARCPLLVLTRSV